MPGLAHDESLLTQATELVSTTEKTFRPQEIPVQHQQLRHYLKATESGLTYYATRNQAYALKGRKRKLIARLDFKIQCLTAGCGWLCVGGPEKGQCAFLRLQMEEEDGAPSVQDTSAVDALLPLNLQSLVRSGSPEGLRRVRSNSSSGFPQSARSIHYKKIGEEIVNAITIQSIPSNDGASQRETVAVVATNDCTVTVYSLDRMEVIQTLYFQQAMNHASLSPNGDLLVACGDVESVFFFSRKRLRAGAFVQRSINEWEELAAPRITSFAPNDHCFSTAFSPDGRYCIVASQAGLMVKLDVKAIHADMRDDAATVEKLTSSRPAPPSRQSTYLWRGAIRSTAFSSSVWGLLAWSETRGRVCVGDMRNRNRPPQVIVLARKDPENKTVELSDASPNDIFNDDEPLSQTLRRVGSQRPTGTVRDQLSEVSTAVDYLEEAARHRQLQQLLQSLDRETQSRLDVQPRLQDLMDEISEMGEDLDNLETGSSSREVPIPPRRRSSVVFTVGDERSSSAAASSLAPVIPSISGLSTSPLQLGRERPPESPAQPVATQSGTSSTSTDPWQTIAAHLPGASDSRSRRTSSLEVSLRNLRETRDSLQRAQRVGRMRADQLAREMDWERHNAARLRTSRPAAASNASARQAATAATRNRRGVGDADGITRSDVEQALGETTSRLSQVERDLAQLESPQARTYNQTSQNPESSTTSTARARDVTLPSLRNAERARYQSLLQVEATAGSYLPPGQSVSPFRLRDAYDGGGDDDEPEIMGLDWSHDGRILFVATDVGIFELKVNLAARKTFSAPTRLQ